jgi:uncharacterized surface protein with fasciclin (FAS1) repeats
MKKFFICVSLALAGLMTSCIDKYEEVDAESKPSWLGESIYAELKNPATHGLLTGTFNNYLHLIDDLGYDEVLARTGSKTIFPANDEAFDRFFKSNDWGVTSYEQLSESQKKLLLYSSMLDNALLLGLLPNVSNGTNDVMKGQAVKHATNVSIIDTVQHIVGSGSTAQRPDGMPANNKYWEKYYDKGIHVVNDATRPMMVHLTREYMLNNDIKVNGDDSDFAYITGETFTEGTAYIFNDKVINGDVTCQNGYIHQMENVVVPPGNMAQLLQRKDNTKYFSRIIDYFSAPYYDAATTKNYNDWALTNNRPQIDSIYQVRYLSNRSQNGSDNRQDPNGQNISSSFVLGFDPGWNQYYPNVARAGSTDVSIMDIGAMFVPSDQAVKDFFLEGGAGAYLIDIYGNYKYGENTEAHLAENLDSLHSQNPSVLTEFANNLMQASFVRAVPSKFETLTNDASELLGVTTDILERKAEGGYDIAIANNGVLYVINELIAPDRFQSVMGPSSVYPDMSVMGWAVDDRTYLGVDFQFYLKAMRANYAFFVPEDGAFDLYYLDPTSLGHLNNNQAGTIRPDVLHFYTQWKDTTNHSQGVNLKCDRYYYDMETGQIDESVQARPAEISTVKTQLVDILNYHTVVLAEGERIGSNKYYKTKHGGEIYFEKHADGGRVMSGAQIDDPERFPAPVIKYIYDNQKNGETFRLSRVIQPPLKSVYSVLSTNEQFSEFLEMCSGFVPELLEWAGIPKENPKNESLPSPQDAYTIFTRDYKLGAKETAEACLDYNVKMFNTYNYTLFAPDNTAMHEAYSNGLPTWSDVQELFEKYAEMDPEMMTDQEKTKLEEDKALAYLMIRAMRDFVRFHFVTNSVYADNSIEGGRYQTLSSDELGVAKEVVLSGGSGSITVADQKSGHKVTVSDATSGSKVINQMTRDYWFNSGKTNASAIETSSFCAIHQVSEPLYGVASGKFNDTWASREAFLKAKKQLNENNEY